MTKIAWCSCKEQVFPAVAVPCVDEISGGKGAKAFQKAFRPPAHPKKLYRLCQKCQRLCICLYRTEETLRNRHIFFEI